jgi:iron complex transport system substrate-binding protein
MAAPQRIVSLLPSSTEILCALGLEDSLVGISHECDYPERITDRPHLTASRIDGHGDSHAIDQEVRALVRDGLSTYRIDTDQLRALQPDLILTQDQCAVSYAEVVTVTQQVLGTDVAVLSLRPNLLQDIWADIRRVGKAVGRLSAADGLLDALFARVNTIVAETIRIPQLPRVAVIGWIAPLRLAGNWVPELIQIAGGQDGLGTPGEPASTVAWETLCEYGPEVLALIPCGYSLEQMLSEAPTLAQWPGWHDLPAVRQGQVYAVDGHAYFNRPGPRIVDSLEILAGLIHPELFGEFLEEHASAYQRLTL